MLRTITLILTVLLAVAAQARETAAPDNPVFPAASTPLDTATTRAQLDTVGFATSPADFQRVLRAASMDPGAPGDPVHGPAVAAVLPHDDYVYAGRTVVPALDALRAPRWIVFGVCHACRRLGVRGALMVDDRAAWRVAGRDFAVDAELREELLRRLDGDLRVDRARHAAEHSVEALLPWLGAAVNDVRFVPILVPGMEPDELLARADRVARALADVCRERGWEPGRDLGILVSADAVHYGCDGWGDHPYAPFGCDEAGHAAARAQDVALARDCLSGPLTDTKLGAFMDRVWNRDGPDYPTYPYRVTWCGLYSIPCGLAVAARLTAALDGAPLQGRVVRYGDSVTDGRLDVPGTRLGVTAPNTLRHWVGYLSAVYTAGAATGHDGAR